MKNLHTKMMFCICLMFSVTFINANTLDDGGCPAPYSLEAMVTGLTTATISWNGHSLITKYKLRYRIANSGDPWQEMIVFGTSVNLTNLTANNAYIYQVKAVCDSENSAWESGSFNNAQCDPPSTTLVTLLSQSSARISWGAVAGATKYKVRYRAMGGNWSTVYTQRLSRMLNGLSMNTVYQYQVKSKCDAGWGEWTTIDSFYIDEDAFGNDINARLVSDQVSIKMFPNPTSDVLNIDISNGEITQIQLLNANGQTIRIIESNAQINVSSLTKGFYMLQIRTTEDEVLTERFVKF